MTENDLCLTVLLLTFYLYFLFTVLDGNLPKHLI